MEADESYFVLSATAAWEPVETEEQRIFFFLFFFFFFFF